MPSLDSTATQLEFMNQTNRILTNFSMPAVATKLEGGRIEAPIIQTRIRILTSEYLRLIRKAASYTNLSTYVNWFIACNLTITRVKNNILRIRPTMCSRASSAGRMLNSNKAQHES
ncbi:hypothetical protein M758_12G157400 [Ceratodon purpureus]|nr:hypothetical protein M758_12G157400 [Ceratodon purpureus]